MGAGSNEARADPDFALDRARYDKANQSILIPMNGSDIGVPESATRCEP